VNFAPLKTLANSGFSKIQIEYFLAFSPAFLSKGFLIKFLEGNTDRNKYGELSEWSKVQHSKSSAA